MSNRPCAPCEAGCWQTKKTARPPAAWGDSSMAGFHANRTNRKEKPMATEKDTSRGPTTLSEHAATLLETSGVKAPKLDRQKAEQLSMLLGRLALTFLPNMD